VPVHPPVLVARKFIAHHLGLVYIHIMAVPNSKRLIPGLPCTCANLRRAARAVTRLYNWELKSVDIEITQFTLLMALDTTGEIPQGSLGKLLALDSTSLTRMLDSLRKKGWVKTQEGDDRRFRIFSLTKAGREQFQRSLPHWRRAQNRLKGPLGDSTLAQLTGMLTKVTVASTAA
jgi:DNA-binding MarR family transcriptional regulator